MRLKHTLACMLCSNPKLNRQVLRIKRSWDEVSCILAQANVNSGKRRRH